MNLSVKINIPKYSDSNYLEQLFATRFQNELNPHSIFVIIEKVKKDEENNNMELPKDLSPEEVDDWEEGVSGLDFAFKVQTRVNETINEKADNIRASIHEDFLRTHRQNVVSFEAHIPRDQYVTHIENFISESIPPIYWVSEEAQKLKQKIFTLLRQEFTARVLMRDDEMALPHHDITIIDCVLLEDGHSVRVKYANHTKIYQKFLADALLENKALLESLVRLYLLTGSIQRSDLQDEHNKKVELKAISNMVRKIFSYPNKYKEFELDNFLYRISADNIAKFYWPQKFKKPLRLEELHMRLFNQQFKPAEMNQAIINRLLQPL